MSNTTKDKPVETETTEATTAITTVEAGGMMIDAEDIDIPRLNIVQKTSDIDFEVGSLVLDKTHEIFPRETKGNCIILNATKMWREDIPFDVDEMPRLAYTKDQMTQLKDDSEYDIIEFAEITMLFPEPEGNEDDEAYPMPIGDSKYAIGRINVQKDAYRKTYKALATFATFNRTTPMNSLIWHFESQLISRGKYSWYVPTLSVTSEKVPQSVADFVASFTQ